MASVTFAADAALKSEMSMFPWVNWSEVARQELSVRRSEAGLLLKKLRSAEEQELVAWSVELGRKVKKGRFRKLLSEVSPEMMERLLKAVSPEKKEELQG